LITSLLSCPVGLCGPLVTRGRPDLARGPEFVRHLSGLRLVPDYDLTAVAPGSVCSCATPMIFGFFVHR